MAPLAVVAPATVAALAYVNAKASVFYDLALLRTTLVSTGRLLYRQHYDRLNFFYLLESWALSPRQANHDLILFEGKRHTYAQVYDRILRYGTWMRERLGVRPNDIVAMDFQNSDTFIFVWFALWHIGATPAFINYNLTDKPLSHSVRVSTAKLCLIDPHVISSFSESVRAELKDVVELIELTPELEAEAFSTEPVRSPDEDRHQDHLSDMALLIYTSGTTGLPKPAIVSWGKCTVGSGMGNGLLGLDRNEVMHTAMPLYHSSAAILSFLAVVQSGSTQSLSRKFSTRTFWAEVRAHKATMIQYVGETLRYLLAAPIPDPPSLDRDHRVRLAWGNGLRPDVWNEFKERFGVETIAEMYSATESTFGTFNISRNDFSRGAIGRNGWLYNALLSRQIAIVEVNWATDQPFRDDKTGFCRRVKPGEPGEMLFRLPDDPAELKKRFQGYFNHPAATGKKIVHDCFAKGDSWYRSDDVVRWGSDGLVFFHDRIGDTFRWKAENVSTAEVSQALGTHPRVRDANVYGVQLPHHDGRAGCAAVHLDVPDLAHPSAAEVLRDIASHVRASLPRFAVPLFLRILDGEVGQQSTGTFKHQKNGLRDLGVKPAVVEGQGAEGQGADASGGPGVMYWLQGPTYVPFTTKNWQELEGGRVKL